MLDLWEGGTLDPANPNPELRPDVLLGRVLALRELTGLSLADIQRAYGAETEAAETGTDDERPA